MAKVYLAARYDKGSADYINCPMTKEEYDPSMMRCSPPNPSNSGTGRS